MSVLDPKSLSALGFLTVIEHEHHGLTGGYLILNKLGRPLEFHCTAPVKPSRAQEILYGPTLEPYLYGEQIGHTLLSKASIKPAVVCTDSLPVLAVRQYCDLPVVMVLGTQNDEQPKTIRIDPAHRGEPPLVSFTLGSNRLALEPDRQNDLQKVESLFGLLAESFDLSEPFERICQAIEEAQRPRS